MASSLKSCFPVLSGILNETPASLYSKQRALVRGGLLKSVPGRGPGSGVHASADSIASLVIGLVTFASIAENAPQARAIAGANVLAQSACRFTGAKTFGAAFSRILGDETLAARVTSIQIAISLCQVVVRYDGDRIPPPPGSARAVRAGAHTMFACRSVDKNVFALTADLSGDFVEKLSGATIKLLAEQSS